jgi:hypothetical protein
VPKIYLHILEDCDERILGFDKALKTLATEMHLHVWRDAPSMIAKSIEFYENASLFSLDHDLNATPETKGDPGTGMDVARFLAKLTPICPVIIHSTNFQGAWSMHNELRFGGWQVERVGPIGNDWIEKLWLPRVKSLLKLTAL